MFHFTEEGDSSTGVLAETSIHIYVTTLMTGKSSFVSYQAQRHLLFGYSGVRFLQDIILDLQHVVNHHPEWLPIRK